jgi:hypothetical protein
MDQPLKADPLEFSSYTKELPFLYLCGGLRLRLHRTVKKRKGKEFKAARSYIDKSMRVYNRSLQQEFTMGVYNRECGVGSGQKSYRSLQWEFTIPLLACTATPLLQPRIWFFA